MGGLGGNHIQGNKAMTTHSASSYCAYHTIWLWIQNSTICTMTPSFQWNLSVTNSSLEKLNLTLGVVTAFAGW